MSAGPMTGRGVRLTDEQWAELERRAAADGKPVGAYMRGVLDQVLNGATVMPPRISEHHVAGWLEGFGEKLRITRQRRGTSLRALGEQLEMRADVLHHIEHGRMMPNTRELEAIRAWVAEA